MAAHKAGEPGCCCGPPCNLCVAPTNPCGPIVGATVTIYGNTSGPDNNGADIDPANNDTTYGTGTTGTTGSFCLVTTPGVYMVETVATGYETDRRLTYGCMLCGELSPKFAVGNTVNLNTDGLDTTLTAVHDATSTVGVNPVTNGLTSVPVSEASNTFPVPSVQVTATGYGGFTCDPYTGLTVAFYAGCGSSGMVEAYYEIPVWRCSTDAFGNHYEFRGAVTGSAFGDAGFLRVTGTVTAVRISPLRITGTWPNVYSYFHFANATSGTFAGPGDPRGLHDPRVGGIVIDTPAPPLVGPFTIT